jgi:hypothetical protein
MPSGYVKIRPTIRANRDEIGLPHRQMNIGFDWVCFFWAGGGGFFA